MKVLIGIPCLFTGGTEHQTLNLVRVLKSEGHNVLIVCYYEYLDDMVDLFEKFGAEVVLLSPKFKERPRGLKQFFFIFKHFKKLIKNYMPDVVHIQYMAPGAIPIIAAKWYGVKTIFATVHQPYTKGHGILSKMILRLSAKLCKCFIAVSKNAESSWFGSSALYNEDKLLEFQPNHFTIYNAVDIDKIKNIQLTNDTKELKKQLGISCQKLVFGVVSRLRHEKGIDVLIEAFGKLVIDIENIHLLIIGNGEDEVKLKKAVSKLNIENSVTFFGEVSWEKAMQQMTIMDVVVVPSRFEGFGLTAAEALVMGKPVVASNVFGLKEVVSNRITGLLFENGNSEDLYLKLKNIIEDTSQYKQFSENATKYSHQFGLTAYNKKMISLHKI